VGSPSFVDCDMAVAEVDRASEEVLHQLLGDVPRRDTAAIHINPEVGHGCGF
jgi:hypothetical protein